MNPALKALKQIFDSQSRESERLVKALAELEATWPTIKGERDRIDLECIALAHELGAQRLAASPRALETETLLKRKRWDRDRDPQEYRIRRADLHQQLDNLTREPIRKFIEFCLETAKAISALYKFEKVEKLFDPTSERRPYIIRVRHNGAALDRAKEAVFKAMGEVRVMDHCTLSAIQAKIEKHRADFEDIDVSTLETIDVSPDAADMMRPRAEPDNFQTGYIIGPRKEDHIILSKKPEPGRISNLSDRLTKLEAKI